MNDEAKEAVPVGMPVKTDFDGEGNPICCNCGEVLLFAGNKIRKLLLMVMSKL